MRPTITLTAAPGAVFLRASRPVIEMSPGEALRVRDELDRLIRTALASTDGRGLLALLARWRGRRPPSPGAPS